jgi:hypothetical protein
VAKSRSNPLSEYQERISELEKRLAAAVEEHRRMRRELEALELRDPCRALRASYPVSRVDDDARN